MTELEKLDDKIQEIKVEGDTHYIPKGDSNHEVDPDCPCAPVFNGKVFPNRCYVHRIRRTQ